MVQADADTKLMKKSKQHRDGKTTPAANESSSVMLKVGDQILLLANEHEKLVLFTRLVYYYLLLLLLHQTVRWISLLKAQRNQRMQFNVFLRAVLVHYSNILTRGGKNDLQILLLYSNNLSPSIIYKVQVNYY